LGMEPVTSRAEAATVCASSIQLVMESTWKALQCMAERMAQNAEEVGLDTTHIRVNGHPSQKLTEKWIGPYKILSVKPNAVELHLLKSLCIHPVVNVSCVKPYRGP
ncbi:hypothetical protein PISMIDRAFT_39015, partial [Pisolithus microcarpus 441]